MEDKLLMTYSLLSHLKELHASEKGSLIRIFEPIVKKSIFEFAKQKGTSQVMGKSILEIQEKIKDFFGIEIPNGVLSIIMRRISDDINDEKVFVYHNHGSFIINSFIFSDLDSEIEVEKENIDLLRNDYKDFCELYNYTYNFPELIDFICALKIDLFTDSNSNILNTKYIIPRYISQKLNDGKLFKTISDIYLGNILSSYLNFKITKPVTDTELLIDTNYFISLIDLNTEEAYHTSNQLHTLCSKLGFKFSILDSTVEQIKYLLSSRIQDFVNKDIGFVKEADIFGACIRNKLDKTQLERIKDKVDSLIRDYKIDVIVDARILPIISEAKKSQTYKDLLQKRHGNKFSALNDAVAYIYVRQRRGRNIGEFSDVKCWFLHNSYMPDYESTIGYKIHERSTINANELLTLLWLTNPDQGNINSETITKGGLATYIAKYRCTRIPSNEIITTINQRAKSALKVGRIKEKDIYSLTMRMSEGHLASNEIEELSSMPDDQFISTIQKYSNLDKETLQKVDSQAADIELLRNEFKNIKEKNVKIERDNERLRHDLLISDYNKKQDEFATEQLIKRINKMNSVTTVYLIAVFLLSVLWIIDKLFGNILHPILGLAIAFILMIVPLSIIRFVEHKTVFQCLRFTFFKRYREKIKCQIVDELRREYETKNRKPEFV